MTRLTTGETAARAATQRGETGDKIPGFDPAAAPMETDSEAGGAPSGGAAGVPAETARRPPETSTGSAMRPMEGRTPPARTTGWWVAIGLLLAAAAAVFAAVILE